MKIIELFLSELIDLLISLIRLIKFESGVNSFGPNKRSDIIYGKVVFYYLYVCATVIERFEKKSSFLC